MPNILLTARNSFVSKTILKHLGDKYSIDSFTHQELDLTNINKLREILDNKYYDFVINPAIAGKGRLLTEDSYGDFYNNMLMMENTLFLKEKYGRLIYFSSAAGNNRQKDIENLKEGEFKEPPINRYSLAKYLCNRRIHGLDQIINLRIFNLFGIFERDDRFIKSNILKYINKQPIEIWGDVYFDFFGEHDFITVLEYLINNPPEKYYELNLCYLEKYKLSQITGLINYLDNYRVNVKITDGINKNYYGSGTRLAELNLSLNGLRKEIENMYNILKHGT